MGSEEIRAKFESIRKRAMEHGLIIARIPKQTKDRFRELAKEEFENDYGMLVKWLIDFRDGILEEPNQILNDKIENYVFIKFRE